MKANWMSLFLAVLHGVSGLAILIVSSWFIAACAIASVNFNYMLPAVVIRALALLRIASGYGHMWFGHHHLLALTAKLRFSLFSKLKFSTINLRADGVEALATHTESIAAVWVGWVAMQASAIAMLLISFTALIVFNIPFSFFTAVVIVGWIAAVVWLTLSGLKIATDQVKAETAFRFESEHYLSSSSIWHLYKNSNNTPSAMNSWQLSQRQVLIGNQSVFVLQGLAWSVLLAVLYQYNGDLLGKPLALIVPMMLLSASDWLGRSLTSQNAFIKYRQGSVALKALEFNSLSPISTNRPNRAISLEFFNAEKLAPSVYSMTFNVNSITLLCGSSGSGKSLLLKAISGLEASIGNRFVDSEKIEDGLIEGWVYVAQQPEILQANLRANLQIANEKASDDTLMQVLAKVGLFQLTDLNEWLGAGGRTLSGGERKRLAVARVMLSEAPLWLIDEPFEGLDKDSCSSLARLFNDMAKSKIIVIASHLFPLELDITKSYTID